MVEMTTGWFVAALIGCFGLGMCAAYLDCARLLRQAIREMDEVWRGD